MNCNKDMNKYVSISIFHIDEVEAFFEYKFLVSLQL